MANPSNKNYRIVVGIDESGRGPLAGHVVACAITGPAEIKNLKLKIKNYFGTVGDSKQLTSYKRESIYNFLYDCAEVKWGIGRVSQNIIDKINILEATKLAMKRAVFNLEKKLGRKADFLLIDGNFGIDLPCPQKSIVKGDEKVFLILLASIVAKVTRDRGMLRYHKKYPQYGFDKHKGYGTKLHMATLAEYGPCEIHRASFKPVSEMNGVVMGLQI